MHGQYHDRDDGKKKTDGNTNICTGTDYYYCYYYIESPVLLIELTGKIKRTPINNTRIERDK